MVSSATYVLCYEHTVLNRYISCSLIAGDFAAAAVLISFGAVLGKVSPLQLVVMAIVEVIFYTANEYVGVGMLRVRHVYCLLVCLFVCPGA